MKKLTLYIFKKNIKLTFLFLSSILFYLVSDSVYVDWFAIAETQIDPFIYWGTGEVFQYIKFHFSETYYFRRWTTNLVNFFFHIYLAHITRYI